MGGFALAKEYNKAMKKLCFLIILEVLFISNYAVATVGGPTLVHSFKYNPVDESVYYVVNSESGRGCPPELMKISLNSGKSQVVLSCDEGEKLIERNSSEFSTVYAEIEKRTQNFKFLTPINLKDNRISIDISFINYEKISPEIDEIKNANFVASVYQDNKKIVDLPISGCNLEQPFIFAGYAIPGFEKKIILLSSTKGDCWEGGYIYENLHVVGGVNNLNKTGFNFYKNQNPLIPNEGTLVVFESEGINKNAEASEKTPSSSKNIYTITAVILGLGLGYFLGRRVKK